MNEAPVGSGYKFPQGSYKNQKIHPVEGRRDMEYHYGRDLLTKVLTEDERVTLHSLFERASMWISITGNTMGKGMWSFVNILVILVGKYPKLLSNTTNIIFTVHS